MLVRPPPGSCVARLAVSTAGRFALVAWEASDAAGTYVHVARWDGAHWTVDLVRDDPRRLPGRPSVAVDSGGNALVVWSHGPYALPDDRRARPLRAVYGRVGEPWPRPRTIARLRPAAVDPLATPAASFAGRARPVVSWATPWLGVPVKVRALALVRGRWRTAAPPAAPRALARWEEDGREPTLVVVTRGGAEQYRTDAPVTARLLAGGGRVALVWTGVPPDRPLDLFSRRAVYYSLLEPDGFTGPFAVPDIGNTAEACAVLRPDGGLVVAYAGVRGVYSVTLDPALGWRAPVSVTG